jgi:hypothetical protein
MLMQTLVLDPALPHRLGAALLPFPGRDKTALPLLSRYLKPYLQGVKGKGAYNKTVIVTLSFRF